MAHALELENLRCVSGVDNVDIARRTTDDLNGLVFRLCRNARTQAGDYSDLLGGRRRRRRHFMDKSKWIQANDDRRQTKTDHVVASHRNMYKFATHPRSKYVPAPAWHQHHHIEKLWVLAFMISCRSDRVGADKGEEFTTSTSFFVLKHITLTVV